MKEIINKFILLLLLNINFFGFTENIFYKQLKEEIITSVPNGILGKESNVIKLLFIENETIKNQKNNDCKDCKFNKKTNNFYNYLVKSSLVGSMIDEKNHLAIRIDLVNWGTVHSIGTYKLFTSLLYKGDTFTIDLVQQSEREGVIENAWLSDFDKDNIPELIFYSKSVGSGGYGNLVVLEFLEKKLLWKLLEIEENKEVLQGYMGYDTFTVSKDFIVRRFPIYKEEDDLRNPSGGVRSIYYYKEKDKIKVKSIENNH